MRNKAKITQEAFCEELGCEVRSLYRWERGLAYPLKTYRSKIKQILPNIGKI